MFTARFPIGFGRPLPGRTRPGGVTSGQASRGDGVLRVAALMGFLALGLPGTSSAQALGTMQVAAQVVPASVGWTGLAEAMVAARSAAAHPPGRTFIRRGGLVQTTAKIHPSGGRGLLIVTLQHPHN